MEVLVALGHWIGKPYDGEAKYDDPVPILIRLNSNGYFEAYMQA